MLRATSSASSPRRSLETAFPARNPRRLQGGPPGPPSDREKTTLAPSFFSSGLTLFGAETPPRARSRRALEGLYRDVNVVAQHMFYGLAKFRRIGDLAVASHEVIEQLKQQRPQEL